MKRRSQFARNQDVRSKKAKIDNGTINSIFFIVKSKKHLNFFFFVFEVEKTILIDLVYQFE